MMVKRLYVPIKYLQWTGVILVCLLIIYIFIQTNTRSFNRKEHNIDILPKSRQNGLWPHDHPYLVNMIMEDFISTPPPKETRDTCYMDNQKGINRCDYDAIESISQYGQDVAVLKFLDGFNGGFFVECGAGDGGWFSNSLLLELKHDWTGLLVEANPHQYKKLKSRHRHVYSINSCLSISPYPEELDFRMYKNHTGLGGLLSEGNGPHDTWHGKKLEIMETVTAQCFPLYSILLALGNPTVHYFSLDVEGVELKVLKTIPWDKVDIKLLTVEVSHSNKNNIKEFMETKNYTLHSVVEEDFVFVKRGFKVYDQTTTRSTV